MAINTTTPSILGMQTMRNKIAHTGHNIANNDTPGFKAIYDALYDVQGDNGVSSIETYTISTKGASTYTGIATDLAIEGGNGMFAVIDKNDPNKTLYYMPTGMFRANNASQLEYLGQYLLMGQAYDMKTGQLIGGKGDQTTFIPVAFGPDKSTATAVATTEITASFDLKSDALVSGQPQILIEPKADPRTRQNLGPLNAPLQLTDVLAPDMATWGYNEGMILGSGFNVAVSRLDGTQVITDNVSCEFGGIAATSKMASSGVTIPNTAIDTLTITYGANANGAGGTTVTIASNQIHGGNDQAGLTNLGNILNGLGFRTRLITDTPDPTVAGSATLLIAPPSTSMSMSMSFGGTGTLANALGLAGQSIAAAQAGTNRFASMGDLAGALTSSFAGVLDVPTSANIILNGKPNNSVTFTNDNPAQNILAALGLNASGTEVDSGYDPYNSGRNIAGGAFVADMIQTVNVYDSLGKMHPMNIGLKKVSTNTWSMEVYVANQAEIAGATRSDGLLQASKLVFDTNGNLVSTSSFSQSAYSTVAVNPFVPLNAVNNQDIIVNGVTLNYLTPTRGVIPTATQFTSMIDLVNAINNNAALQMQVTASLENGPQSGTSYLKLTPVNNSAITVTSATPGVIPPPFGNGTSQTITQALGGMQQEALVPNASTGITIQWAATAGSATSNITLNTAGFYQAVQAMSGEVTADGYGVGLLTDIEVGQNGDVVGTYTNGANIKLYSIPVGTFQNINGLTPRGDNSYAQSINSGTVNFAGTANAALTISAGNIESSNSDIAEQLTNMMIANQTYGACTKSLQVGLSLVDTLLTRV